MSDRSTADVLYQTVWLIEKTRLKTRRLIERGDALLYQPTAIINSGLSRISFNPEAIIKDTSKSVNKKREQILANLAVTAGLIDRVDQAVLAAASYSVASIDLSLTKCRDNLSQLWYEIPRLIIGRLSNLRLGLSEFLTDIRNNWNSFIGGSKDLLLTPTSHSVDSYIGSEAELREQIRRELLTELQGEFDSVFERLRGGEPMILRQPGQGQSGMVVVPAGETIESNDAIKNRLEQMFSDPVSVRFDSDGQSGIITPEFRNRSGGDYIFLLAPILQ
jgi:hypothetical protein